ncbi:helix-turn-helix domain-containing protein [Streptomyces sp. NBC_01361]|uniref:helix-turn-helix domain-containing protein n=1 Tax=Streptomyces sp. NBC_01361 TaxID=2903838 RepID=UPI002E3512D7|nr:helix-turn-helix domain-containing protein [Streptomyces sp. NBC_01361]
MAPWRTVRARSGAAGGDQSNWTGLKRSRLRRTLRCRRRLRPGSARPDLPVLHPRRRLAGSPPAACPPPFRRHQDTTPLAHLRAVRLANAHRDLLTANPDTTTVTAIATRWGFLHPGRFTAQYRTLYGHSPTTTTLRQ